MRSMTEPPPAERLGDVDEISSSWRPLIDEWLEEARATLTELEAAPEAGAEGSRQAWRLIGHAFESSANALSALCR
jgi:hypothetical protein